MTKVHLIRKCQECGHKHHYRGTHPNELSLTQFERYCERDCRRCHSTALDYGTPAKEEQDVT